MRSSLLFQISSISLDLRATRLKMLHSFPTMLLAVQSLLFLSVHVAARPRVGTASAVNSTAHIDPRRSVDLTNSTLWTNTTASHVEARDLNITTATNIMDAHYGRRSANSTFHANLTVNMEKRLSIFNRSAESMLVPRFVNTTAQPGLVQRLKRALHIGHSTRSGKVTTWTNSTSHILARHLNFTTSNAVLANVTTRSVFNNVTERSSTNLTARNAVKSNLGRNSSAWGNGKLVHMRKSLLTKGPRGMNATGM